MDPQQTERATEIDIDIEANWVRIKELTPGTFANRLALGQCFHDLRSLYSDRNSGGHRLTSAHGGFEAEIIKRGYKPRTVRGWVADYEAALAGKPSSAAKRRAHRLRRTSHTTDTLTTFATLLPFSAAQAAYRTAARLLHPDHGGNARRMQQLNDAWAQAKKYYQVQADW